MKEGTNMNKYKEILNMIGRITLGSFLALAGIASILVYIYYGYSQYGAAGMLFTPIIIPCAGVLLSKGLSVIFPSKYEIISMWLYLIGTVTLLGIGIFSLISMSSMSGDKKIVMIIMLVASLIEAIIYFLIAQSKRVDIKNNTKKSKRALKN